MWAEVQESFPLKKEPLCYCTCERLRTGGRADTTVWTDWYHISTLWYKTREWDACSGVLSLFPIFFKTLNFHSISVFKDEPINISWGQKPLMETSLNCLFVSGMMHSQKVSKGRAVQPAVDHTTRTGKHPETTSSLHANTHRSTALEQR